MTQLSFCHLQKLVLGSHPDFPEYILMTASEKVIRNLDVVIKDKEGYSSNLGKTLQGSRGWPF